MNEVPNVRVRSINDRDVNSEGEYVLYWMIASWRSVWNFGLQRAVGWARELRRPLLIFESLRCGYRWASDRLHQFVIQGMADNARHLARKNVFYYLHMLWGKKVLEWSASPDAALEILIELNNKYALDGRDPNSYSGIFWYLGRYDRAWGPQRPIFGKVRYMSSENTAREVRVKGHLDKYGSSH